MIKWSNNFSVKHTGIDEQHKKLIDIIKEVACLVDEEDIEFTNLLDLVNQLDNYVEEHFKYEETLMKKHSYPEEVEHIKQHNELRHRMECLNIFDVEKTTDFYKELLSYLVNWLSMHIMQTDKKLGLFLVK